LRDVIKTYETGAGDVTVLKDITLKVKRGEFISVVGPSGSGKSTLLNMITGIDRPTEGQVFVGGKAVHKLNENQLARWRGRNVGVIFQFFQLLPTLTILENVMLPMDFCKVYKRRERKEKAMALLELVDIADQAHKLTLLVVTHDRSLSGRTERVLHILDGRLHRDQTNGNANGKWTR
jgi:putative ABC transport system ATP-binding protein